VGQRLEPEHHRLRDFLTRAAQPHEFYEAGSPQAEAVLAKAGARDAELPVVVDGDAVHAGVDVQSLAEAWNVYSRPARTHYDLLIVGAGPAGSPRRYTARPTAFPRPLPRRTCRVARPATPR